MKSEAKKKIQFPVLFLICCLLQYLLEQIDRHSFSGYIKTNVANKHKG